MSKALWLVGMIGAVAFAIWVCHIPTVHATPVWVQFLIGFGIGSIYQIIVTLVRWSVK